jgi:hypothetical protein
MFVYNSASAETAGREVVMSAQLAVALIAVHAEDAGAGPDTESARPATPADLADAAEALLDPARPCVVGGTVTVTVWIRSSGAVAKDALLDRLISAVGRAGVSRALARVKPPVALHHRGRGWLT